MGGGFLVGQVDFGLDIFGKFEGAGDFVVAAVPGGVNEALGGRDGVFDVGKAVDEAGVAGADGLGLAGVEDLVVLEVEDFAASGVFDPNNEVGEDESAEVDVEGGEVTGGARGDLQGHVFGGYLGGDGGEGFDGGGDGFGGPVPGDVGGSFVAGHGSAAYGTSYARGGVEFFAEEGDAAGFDGVVRFGGDTGRC